MSAPEPLLFQCSCLDTLGRLPLLRHSTPPSQTASLAGHLPGFGLGRLLVLKALPFISFIRVLLCKQDPKYFDFCHYVVFKIFIL